MRGNDRVGVYFRTQDTPPRESTRNVNSTYFTVNFSFFYVQSRGVSSLIRKTRYPRTSLSSRYSNGDVFFRRPRVNAVRLNTPITFVGCVSHHTIVVGPSRVLDRNSFRRPRVSPWRRYGISTTFVRRVFRLRVRFRGTFFVFVRPKVFDEQIQRPFSPIAL